MTRSLLDKSTRAMKNMSLEYIPTSTLLILYIYLSYLECLNAKLTFSKSIAKNLIFKRIPNISIDKCRNECKTGPQCKQIIYHRAAKVCSLTVEADNTDYLAHKGDVIVTGNDVIRLENLPCGDAMCNDLETCVTENNRVLCKIKGCGIVDSPYLTVYGNIFDVNSKLIRLNEGDEAITIKCGADGLWMGDNSWGCCETGCKSGIVSWPYTQALYYCDMVTDGGKWMVFQRRVNGSANFFRNWDNYRKGFGNFHIEFWLGLRNMYNILSTGNFELRIDLEDFENETRYAKYSNFSIDGPADNYRLHVSGYSGDAGDSFAIQDGQMFSTHDNDKDNYTIGNCAFRYKGAWWYNRCHYSNLNGLYFHGGENTTVYAQHIHWYTWHGYFFSLKSCEMKFRRKEFASL